MPAKALKYLFAVVSAALLLSACSKKSAVEPLPTTIVKFKSELLDRSDLEKAMPRGLSEADSLLFANAFIREWINTRLIEQVATVDIDMSTIDKQVDQYRRQLIMEKYGKLLYEQKGVETIDEDTLKAYYDAHPEEFKLKRPLVRGVYMKIANESKSLAEVRKLYRKHSEADIDRLDKSMLDGAVHYDYFRDRWVDWEQIEKRIPYDFGSSADAFLRSHTNVDTSEDGFTYLLDISEVMHSGQTMPYEAARPLIEERLNFNNRRDYHKWMMQSLYDKAIERGALEIFY